LLELAKGYYALDEITESFLPQEAWSAMYHADAFTKAYTKGKLYEFNPPWTQIWKQLLLCLEL
jgi:hypothetical protein